MTYRECVERRRKRSEERDSERWFLNLRCLFDITMTIGLVEGMHTFGSHAIRGYSAFGGESLLLMAVLSFAVYRQYKKTTGED